MYVFIHVCSAAISACDKLLLWGWGEEGQLGNGSEKDSWLPRPVRLPDIQQSKCVPMTVSLGMCHTVVAVRNKNYSYQPTVESIEIIEKKKIEEESICLPIVCTDVSHMKLDTIMSYAQSPMPLLESDNVFNKQSVVVVESVDEIKPIQSLKDILSHRENR